jgi:hypothetical protein
MYTIILLRDTIDRAHGDVLARSNDWTKIFNAWFKLSRRYGKGAISSVRFNLD